MVETTRTINLPLYLEVMGYLPGVTSADISSARQALTDAFGGLPSSVTFERGIRSGDGDIVVTQNFRGDDGRTYNTTLHLLENGTLANYDAHFNRSLPSSLSRYFFAGIFGTDELSSSVRSADTSAILAWRWNPVFDPQQQPSISNYAPEIMEGARLLYSCAEGEESVSACLSSDGSRVIEAVRSRYESDRVAHEQALRENAQRQLEAQVQAAAQERQAQIDNYMQRSEAAWQDAERVRDASVGWADGDPDVVQEIMDRYQVYRYYGGTSDDLENARIRYEKSREMMQAIADDDDGWPQFSELLCTSRRTVEGQHHCDMDTSDYGTTHYTCSYGVTNNIRFGRTQPCHHGNGR